MIRLVTQFDSPSSHPSFATPSGASSSSSCCCCCVATAIGVSVFSTVHVRRLRLEALRQKREKPAAGSPWPEALGCFALAIALGIGALLGWAVHAAFLAAVPVVWGVLLYFAYRSAGDDDRGWHAGLTVIFGLGAAVFEFVIWFGALS